MYFQRNERGLSWAGTELNSLLPQIRQHLIKHYDYQGPFYAYHGAVIEARCKSLQEKLPNAFFYYSLKSLSNIHIIKKILSFDRFGLDIVSLGELERALLAGGKPEKIVFAGVAKTKTEILSAIKAGIRSFHVESVAELRSLQELAASVGAKAGVALRMNPDVEVDTHKYITTGKEENKFGISRAELPEILHCLREGKNLQLKGLQAHIGSQILDPVPYAKSLAVLNEIAQALRKENFPHLEYISLGGGFGVDYKSMYSELPVNQFSLDELHKILSQCSFESNELHFEPGRYISAMSGVLVSKVRHIKPKSNYDIALIDAGMTELLRPALYGAVHPITTLHALSEYELNRLQTYEIAGPICESSDVFARGVQLPFLKEDDDVLILHAGAYGSVMASNYNTRPLAPEVLIQNDSFQVIRRPQTYKEILASEMI